MPYPKITIDHARCQLPMDCKKCLQICPQAIFDVRPTKMVRLQETDKKEPGAFKLYAYYRDKCTGCDECAQACPQAALQVSV